MDEYYRLLGVPRDCDETTLRRAYRQKALLLHPDRNPKGAEEFKRVSQAYDALSLHLRKRNSGNSLPPMDRGMGNNASTATGAHGSRGWNYDKPDVTVGGYTTTTLSSSSMPQVNTGLGAQNARGRQFAEKPPTRVFTEEELFGEAPGGFSHEKFNPRTKRAVKVGDNVSRAGYDNYSNNNNNNNNTINGNNDNNNNNNTNGSRNATSGINTNMRNNDTGNIYSGSFGSGLGSGRSGVCTPNVYEKVDERWRLAHGDRVPVSGYSTHDGAAPSPTHIPRHCAPHRQPKPEEQQQGRMSASRNAATPAYFGSGVGNVTSGHQGERAVGTGPNDAIRRQQQQQRSANKESNNSGYLSSDFGHGGCDNDDDDDDDDDDADESSEDDDDDDDDYDAVDSKSGACGQPGYPANEGEDVLNKFEQQQTMNEVRREWERLKRDTDSKISTSSPVKQNTWNDGRGGGVSNSRFVGADENYVFPRRDNSSHSGDNSSSQTREDRVDGKPGPFPGERNDVRSRPNSPGKGGLRGPQMRSTVVEDLRLKRVLFAERYIPDLEDIVGMSDTDVYLLYDLLSKAVGQLQTAVHSRMTKGPCSCCSAAPKLQAKSFFVCGHAAVCMKCAATCVMCPLCAANRL